MHAWNKHAHLRAMANAYSATTVLPAEVCAATKTEWPGEHTQHAKANWQTHKRRSSGFATPHGLMLTCLEGIDGCVLKWVQAERVLLGGRPWVLNRWCLPLHVSHPLHITRHAFDGE